MAKLPKAKVERIQDMLNNLMNPSPPLELDGLFGKKTAEVLKQLQYIANIKQSGKVDAETAVVIARVMKTGKIEKEQPAVYLKINGKQVGYTQKQYDKIHKDIVAKLKAGPALKIRQNANAARAIWNHFNKMNSDQWFVSWCIEATRGADLPSASVITKALKASQKIDGHLNSGNLGKFNADFPNAEILANEAASQMYAYQHTMIDGGENWVMGLQFTKAASFTFVSIFAAPVAASALGTGALASAVVGNAAVAITQSAAGELGNFAADKKDWTPSGALANVMIDGGVGAILGVFAKGGSGGKYVFETAVKKLGPKIAAEQGFKFLSKNTLKSVSVYLITEGGKGALEGAVKDAGQAAKKDPKMNGDKFVENLVVNFAKGVALGKIGSVIGKFGSGKIPKKIDDKIWIQALKSLSKSSKGKSFTMDDIDNKTKEMIVKMIEDASKKAIDEGVQKVFSMMKGAVNASTVEKKLEAELFSDQRMKEYIAIATKELKKAQKKK